MYVFGFINVYMYINFALNKYLVVEKLFHVVFVYLLLKKLSSVYHGGYSILYSQQPQKKATVFEFPKDQ